jgi:hypothetical protein
MRKSGAKSDFEGSTKLLANIPGISALLEK